MAISYDAAAFTETNAVTTHATISFTIGSGSDRMLAGLVAYENYGSLTDDALSTFTYNGTNLVFSKTSTVGSSRSLSEGWYLGEASLPSTGAYNLIATWTSKKGYSYAGAISMDGVADQAPEATAAAATAAAGSGTLAITTLTANAWIVGVVEIDSPDSTFSFDTATQRGTASANSNEAFIASELIVSSGATSLDWTVTGGSQSKETNCTIMAFAEASSGTTVSATTKALTITTQAASVKADTSVTGTTKALTITSLAASITLAVNIAATTAALVITTQPATVNASTLVDTNLTALSISTYAATVTSTSGNTDVNANTASIVLTSNQASVNAESNINANVSNLTLTTYSSNVTTGTNVDTALTALTITEKAAAITLDVNVAATKQSLIITTKQASIDNGIVTESTATGAPSSKQKLRQIMIGNELFVIKSPEHEQYLLNRYLDKQEKEYNRLIVAKKMPVVKKKIKLVSTQIVRTKTRLKKAEQKVWQQKIQREDEELLLLLVL